MNKISTKINLVFVMLFALVFMFSSAAFADDYDDLSGQEVRVLLKGSSTASSYTFTIGDGEYSIVESDDPDDVLERVEEGDSITFTYNGSNSYSYCVGSDTETVNSPLLAIPESSEDCFYFNGTAYRLIAALIFQWLFNIRRKRHSP